MTDTIFFLGHRTIYDTEPGKMSGEWWHRPAEVEFRRGIVIKIITVIMKCRAIRTDT